VYSQIDYIRIAGSGGKRVPAIRAKGWDLVALVATRTALDQYFPVMSSSSLSLRWPQAGLAFKTLIWITFQALMIFIYGREGKEHDRREKDGRKD
jgi:hypothetical protein